MNLAERGEAAALVRRVLDAVSVGDLTADGAAASGIVKRLEGALIALEALDALPTGVATPREA